MPALCTSDFCCDKCNCSISFLTRGKQYEWNSTGDYFQMIKTNGWFHLRSEASFSFQKKNENLSIHTSNVEKKPLAILGFGSALMIDDQNCKQRVHERLVVAL